MRLLIFFVLVFSFNQLNAQLIEDEYPYSHRIIVQDFNKDGFEDSLTVIYSLYAGVDLIRYVDGELKNIYSFYLTFLHYTGNIEGRFLHFIAIPNDLLRKDYKPLLDTVQKYFFSKRIIKKQSFDSDLEWLYYAYSHLEVDSLWNRTISPKFYWKDSMLSFPESYYLRVNQDTIRVLFPNILDDIKTYEMDSTSVLTKEYFLIYYGHNHRRYLKNGKFNKKMELVVDDKKYRIYRTAHGLIVEQNKKFSWCFQGNNVKLRWPSIGKTELINDFLLVERTVFYTNRFIFINLKNGKIANINLDGDFERGGKFKIKYIINGDKLTFKAIPYWKGNKESEKVFNISELMKELE